ncbi:hypothetical protein ACFQNF_12760 [Iodobacter arcticus]|uniref:Transposase n=1 Tax=Iodobacter arcticus TaxID=590593 RepID=A0ABW2R0L1_9NEIS
MDSAESAAFFFDIVANSKLLCMNHIKEKHTKELDALARVVNMVWNYCNDLFYKKLKRT